MVRALAEATHQVAAMARQMALPCGIVRLDGDPVQMLRKLHTPTHLNYPSSQGKTSPVLGELPQRALAIPGPAFGGQVSHHSGLGGSA